MNKFELIEYIKRQLGAPVINIEISNEQIEDVINDALDLFREYHTDALKLKWIELDLVAETQEYTLSSDVFSIVDIYGYRTQGVGMYDSEDQGYLMKGAYVGNTGTYDDEYSITNYVVNKQMYEMYRAELSRDYVFDYSYLERKLKMLVTVNDNETIAVLAQCFVDSQDSNYSSLWFRKYCVCMSGLAWSQNIGKYTGTSLPGSSQFNYSEIFQKYDAMRLQLEEEIIDRYSETFGIMIG